MVTSIFSGLLLSFLSCTCAANSTAVTSSLDHDNAYLISSGLVSPAATETQSHFRLYWHDIASGPNPTAVPVAKGPGTETSANYFGLVVIIDDPLTTGPDINSKLVGRAQGVYASAGIEKRGLLMAMNFVFTDGKYNGSTIVILGHNDVFSAVREMPIVGGSGLFRFACGYVEARTHSWDQKNHNAVVEYNIFVNHYSDLRVSFSS